VRSLKRFRSIRLKLIVAFMLVSVAPTLVATELATQLVVDTFESSLRVWLYETSRFFFGNLLDERREAIGIADSMIEQGVLDPLASGAAKTLPGSVQKLMDALGYDVLVIYDADKKAIFSSRPVAGLDEAPLSEEATLYTVQIEGRPMLMAGALRPFWRDGRRRFLLVGIFIDENYIGNINALKSFEMRLYYRQGADLIEFYSSGDGVRADRMLRPSIVSDLAGGVPYVFQRAAEGGRFLGVYTPLYDNRQQLLGVIFCGLRSDVGAAGWVSRANIFIAILVLGSALAVLGALLLSRQLTKPLLRLAEGVRAVSAGDYQQAVAVTGRDEVAELSEAFNRMTVQLARLREVEERMRRQERLSTLGEVAAGLAHEVRNPLGIIKTTAELLQRSQNLNEGETRRLGYVVEEVRRIDALIRDFLTFAKTPQVFVAIRPSEIVGRVLDFAQQEAERRGVTISFVDRAPDAIVRGDPGQVYDAVLNLVLNALDAMQGGGRLTIDQSSDGEHVRLVFSDTGPGVPEDIRPRLFDPFVTSKPSGAGLGLAKVFAVMETHGGKVEYKGNPGGAAFELTFPVAASEDDARA
jgi:signal transduction histidine kinase